MADAPAPQPDAEQQPAEVTGGTASEGSQDALLDAAPEVEQEVVEEEVSSAPADSPSAEAAEPEPEEPQAPDTSVSFSATITAAAEAEPTAISSTVPSVASTTEVPASLTTTTSPDDSGEGGEWDLLVQKIKDWLGSGQLQQQWQSARTPIAWGAGLIAVLLVLRIYSALLGVLESIPLLPGLLELAGVIAVVQFSLTRLVRSDDRHQVISGLKQRWSSFRGQR